MDKIEIMWLFMTAVHSSTSQLGWWQTPKGQEILRDAERRAVIGKICDCVCCPLRCVSCIHGAISAKHCSSMDPNPKGYAQNPCQLFWKWYTTNQFDRRPDDLSEVYRLQSEANEIRKLSEGPVQQTMVAAISRIPGRPG